MSAFDFIESPMSIPCKYFFFRTPGLISMKIPVIISNRTKVLIQWLFCSSMLIARNYCSGMQCGPWSSCLEFSTCQQYSVIKQEAHGPHRSPENLVQINNQICSKRWLYHNVDLERRKPIISFSIIKWTLFVKTWVLFTQGCVVPRFQLRWAKIKNI